MKKLILIFVILFTSVLCLTGCTFDSTEETHVHSYSEWVDVVPSTCLEEGTLGHYKCTSCNKYFDENKVEIENVSISKKEHTLGEAATCTTAQICTVCNEVINAALGHSYSNEWSVDETHHWHEATCDCNVEVKDIAEHTWNSGVIEGDTTIFTCIVCQETKEEIIRNEEPVIPEDTEDTISEGLEYELNDDGQSYSVVGIGECIDPDVKIPEIYNNLPVTSIGTLAFAECTSITSIKIPSTVTNIELGGLLWCINLTSIKVDIENKNYKSIDGNLYSKDGTTLIQYATGKANKLFNIPNTVTIVGDYAFSDCIGLTNVSIPSSVTSIGFCAFLGCSELTTITVDIGNKNYESIDGNLYSKDGTVLIQYAVGKTSKSFEIPSDVTSIGENAFSFCNNLESVKISKNVVSIKSYAFYMFENSLEVYYCGTKEEWNNIFIGSENYFYKIYYNGELPSDNDEDGNERLEYELNDDGQSYSVIGIGTYTDSNVVIPTNYKNLPITRICDCAFMCCENVKSVAFEEGSLVTSIGNYAFYGCSNLESIEIPSTITSVGDEAFFECNSLEIIEIPSSITSIGKNSFSGESLASIIVDEGNKNYESIDGNLYSKDGTILIQYAAGKTNKSFKIPSSVTSIGDAAFYNSKNLTNIEIPSSVTSIGEFVFSSCDNLIYNEYEDGLYLGNSDNPYLILVYINYVDSFVFNPNVKYIHSEAFAAGYKLRTISIPSSVKSIGAYAFTSCTSLTTVTFEEGSQLTFIGDEAFAYCCSLTSITIPNSVISIGESAFNGCSNLRDILLPNGLTSIEDSAFNGCSNLISITIPNSVTNIGTYALSGCTNLKYIEIPSSVVSIGEYAFCNCIKLVIVYYEGTDEQWNNIVIGSENEQLESIVVCYNSSRNVEYKLNEDEQTYSVAKIRTDEFTDIIIPHTFNNLPVTGISNIIFNGMNLLHDIFIPNSVTSISDSAFEGCEYLRYVTFEEESQLAYIGDKAFAYCYSLQNIEIPSSVISIGDAAFTGCKFTEVVFEEGSQLKSIGDSAFSACGNLVNIKIPSSVVSFGEYVFSSCENLKHNKFEDGFYLGDDENPYLILVYNDFKNSSIINPNTKFIHSEAFADCNKLSSVTIPAGVISIGNEAFSLCTELRFVTILSGTTKIGKKAFYQCINLKSVEIPDSVTKIGDMAFYGCTRLTDIVVNEENMNYKSVNGDLYSYDETVLIQYALGKNNLSFSKKLTNIGSRAFAGCAKLTNIVIPSSVISIGTDAFYLCTNLRSVSFEEGSKLMNIGEGAFVGCSGLWSIEIPSSIISVGRGAFGTYDDLNAYENGLYLGNEDNLYLILIDVEDTSVSTFNFNSNAKIIYSSAFSECVNLESIEIPSSVVSIGLSAFRDCNNLETVYYVGTKEEMDNIIVEEGNDYFNSATIYYYSEIQPTEEGNYWHYDTDGVTPVVWE